MKTKKIKRSVLALFLPLKTIRLQGPWKRSVYLSQEAYACSLSRDVVKMKEIQEQQRWFWFIFGIIYVPICFITGRGKIIPNLQKENWQANLVHS